LSHYSDKRPLTAANPRGRSSAVIWSQPAHRRRRGAERRPARRADAGRRECPGGGDPRRPPGL